MAPTSRLVGPSLLVGTQSDPLHPDTWQNPGPIAVEVVCVANGDTPVVFALNILRASQ